MLELAVFLGNPGGEYRRNRHNAGRLLAEKLPFYGGLVWRKKYKGLYAFIDRAALPAAGPSLPGAGVPGAAVSAARTVPAAQAAGTVHFLMPETYMNLSGDSVFKAASFFKTAPEGIIAVHDELELPLGTVSLKLGGGLGGHNGLRSMKERLNSAAFWRLRIGIGRPPGRLPGEGGPPGSGGDVTSWVLSDFSPREQPLLEAALEAAGGALCAALVSGPNSLLPEWGKKRLP